LASASSSGPDSNTAHAQKAVTVRVRPMLNGQRIGPIWVRGHQTTQRLEHGAVSEGSAVIGDGAAWIEASAGITSCRQPVQQHRRQ